MPLLKVSVNPRSSRNQVVGWTDDVVLIKLTAAPVDGAANKACVEFLAKRLSIRKSQIALRSGASGRDKLFHVEGLPADEIRSRLAPD